MCIFYFRVYVDGKPIKDVGKSTYGDRVRCGARSDTDGQQLVYFRKNGNIVDILLCLLLPSHLDECLFYLSFEMPTISQVLIGVCPHLEPAKVKR